MTHANKQYHYTECGLDNVYLLNGFEFTATPYGRGVSIHDVDGLHAAIGMKLAEQTSTLEGKEVRFLRHELDLSQKILAGLLAVDEQSVARWEKGKTKIPGPAQRLLSSVYREMITGDSKITENLEKLSALDAEYHRLMTLARSHDEEWVVCAA